MPFSGNRLLTLVPSAALVAAALVLPMSPAQAQVPDAAPAPAARVAPVAQAQIETPTSLADSPVSSVESATGAVRLGEAAEGVTLVPPAAGAAVPVAGAYVSRSTARDFAVSTIPTASGVQMVLTLDSAASPTRYAFAVRSAQQVRPVVAADGGIVLRDRHGVAVGGIERPWAYDAAGKAVATRYVVKGSVVTQVVDHHRPGVRYPVTADPKVKSCNFYTATCIKFSKKEVAKVAKYIGLGKGVSALCALVPGGVLGKVACGVVITPVFGSLSNTFKKAKKAGKCVELKLNRIPPAVNTPIGWKVVGC